MKRWMVTVSVVKASGLQWWEVEAETAEDAIKIHEEGGGVFSGEEIDVMETSKVTVSDVCEILGE